MQALMSVCHTLCTTNTTHDTSFVNEKKAASKIDDATDPINCVHQAACTHARYICVCVCVCFYFKH